MKNLFFKKEHQQKLYSYLNVLKPDSTSEHPLAGLEKNLYKFQFNIYLALAELLTEHLNRYVILRTSPYLVNQPFVKNMDVLNWKYQVLSDDFFGLGMDKGFANIEKDAEEQHVLFSIDSLLLMRELPEDTFGDKVSQVSIFGLVNNRRTYLSKFFQSTKQPFLSDFLKENELFINVISSKTIGYYHSVLIKSVDDIELEINAFQNVIAPDN